MKDNTSFYEKLYMLSLSHNEITSITDNQFINIKNLRKVFLNNNSITIINTNMFMNNTQLYMLDLSMNEIHDFNLELNSLPSLKYLYLQNNLIEVLTQDNFENYITNNSLIIYNNNFTCECKLYWLQNINYDIKSKLVMYNENCSDSSLKKKSENCQFMIDYESGKCSRKLSSICKKGY